MRIILTCLALAVSGCTGMASDVSYTTKTLDRNVGYAINGMPTDARNCATGNCSHNYNSAANNITDNAIRGYRGAGVRGAGNLAEGVTEAILSPIIILTKPDKKYPSLEDNCCN